MKLTITIAALAMSVGAFAQSWPATSLQSKAGARWWWLGSAVDKENISWNMQQYANHGIGALEITPLYGVQGNQANNIDYLSPKWMEMLRHVQAEGKKNNIEVDMATGTGWPFGGPWVPLEESASQMVLVDTVANAKAIKTLQLAPPAKKAKNTRLVGIYAFKDGACVKLAADKKGQLVPTDKKQKLAKGDWRIIGLWQKMGVMMVKRAAPGGAGYVVDHFNKQSVMNYLTHISDAFEKTNTPYPHTFFNDSYEVSEADYTTDLFPEFQKRRGYSLEENLNKLVDGDQKVVSDYRETLGDLILENFTETWTAWAHSHGAITRNQAHGSPANLIDCYAAVDIPEIEGFGLTDFGIKGLRTDPGKTRKNDSDFSMLKYAPSAAHIMDKPYTSSETFTWLTEHFRTSLSQMKPDLDLMFCAGVNHVYFHGTCYSPKNDEWPGWKFYASVDMSPTNSIWRDAPSLMQYIDRCQSFLQWGKPDNDFLTLLPVRDMWAKRSNEKRLMQFAIHNMGKLAPEFVKCVGKIVDAGYDCDYISERLILKTDYKNGMIVTGAGQKYKGLIIPDDKTIMTPEVRKHIEMLKSKGANIMVGINGSQMAKTAKPEVMRTALSLKTIRRSNDKGYHYFISNLTPNDVDRVVKLGVEYKDALWFNPMTGERYAAEMTADGIRIALKSGESMILETFNAALDAAEAQSVRKIAPMDETVINVDKGWCLSFTEEAPEVKGSFSIDKLQTWETLDDAAAKITMGTGVYETTFDVATPTETVKVKGKKKKVQQAPSVVSDRWAIDLGDVRESARVYINNVYVGCAWAVPYVLSFDASVLKAGENTIRIEVTNLPANRIANLDRHGVKWRKMEEINVVDINYKKTTYEGWAPVPSGLNSEVKIYAVK